MANSEIIGAGQDTARRAPKKNAITQGDCMELMQQLPPHSVDMILTDPPYSTPVASAFGRQIVKSLSDLAIQEFYFKAIRKCFERILKPDAPVLIFCDDAYYPVLFAVFYEWKRAGLCIWDKKRIGMGKPFRRRHELIFYGNQGDVDVNKDEMSHLPSVIECSITKQFHGAEKPVELLEKLILGLTKPGAVVLDPFAGSGSTAVAASNTGRDYYAFEMERKYCEKAEDRTSCAPDSPAQNTMEICHTAPNSASMQIALDL